ncbi:MAG TPA: EAL domain-containing protein, partial [Novosphingobium sp.]|nr:EAL domain-containing protein [Novosphingobium sp.]
IRDRGSNLPAQSHQPDNGPTAGPTARHADDAVAITTRAERDIVALGIVVAAIIMFVGTGGSALSKTLAKLQGLGVGPDRLLINALLLNIALVIFGWRRYDELCLEVRQRRLTEARARQMAETDPMTGCLNRRSVATATERLIAAAAAQGQIAAFIMIDVDNFKQINDSKGHSVGDRILIECARRLRAILPAGALAARMGGDEFACITPFAPGQPEAIDTLARAIIEGISRPIAVEGFFGEVTVSVGVTRSDRSSGDQGHAAAMMHMADIAMYHSKKQGRNRYSWFEDRMETAQRHRSEIETGIRVGLGRSEFTPLYEPQFDIASGALVGFEMRPSWQSDDFGAMPAAAFMPVAEEIGAVTALNEGLIAHALGDARGWAPQLRLAINISPAQLADPWFAQKLLKLLVSANFPPSRLDIEITETCLHRNIAGLHTLVASLRNQGVGIVLDDFGKGHASLLQLRQFSFDGIKIDGELLAALAPDGQGTPGPIRTQDARAIVETCAMIGKGLGIPVSAEGVADAATLDLLGSLEVARAQGPHLGAPRDLATTDAMLAAQNLLAGALPDTPAPPPPVSDTQQRRSA